MFRIMSFNVLCYGKEPHFWTLRAPLVCRLIRETLPDSFGVQEAHIDWIIALTEGLPEYDYVGVGRNDGKEDANSPPYSISRISSPPRTAAASGSPRPPTSRRSAGTAPASG